MYRAAGEGNIEKFLSYVSPDIIAVEPGFLFYGGTYRGIDGLISLFGKLTEKFVLESLNIDRILADGDLIVALCTISLRGTGETVVFAERALFENGKAVSLHIYMHDTASLLE